MAADKLRQESDNKATGIVRDASKQAENLVAEARKRAGLSKGGTEPRAIIEGAERSKNDASHREGGTPGDESAGIGVIPSHLRAPDIPRIAKRLSSERSEDSDGRSRVPCSLASASPTVIGLQQAVRLRGAPRRAHVRPWSGVWPRVA